MGAFTVKLKSVEDSDDFCAVSFSVRIRGDRHYCPDFGLLRPDPRPQRGRIAYVLKRDLEHRAAHSGRKALN